MRVEQHARRPAKLLARAWVAAGLALGLSAAANAESTRPGAPLAGLSELELGRFLEGRREFERTRDPSNGLGPLFNESGCNRCHNAKGVGGGGIQVAVMIGRSDGQRFDALLGAGGPVLATASVMQEANLRRVLSSCQLAADGEELPPEANVVVRRRTTPLFGLGLVDATPDAVFLELARRQPQAIRGRAALIVDGAGQRRMGKFGWKSQSPTLHHFAGLALVNELGVTNPEFPEEQLPNGDRARLSGCDRLPEPEDDGGSVARLTDFMARLAPIAPLEQSAEAHRGDALFTRVGCDGCHVRSLTSGESTIRELRRKRYAPYSDFLLHDMGALGDGIREGDAGPREMRTAPLWGLHLTGSSRLLHDGRARSLEQAIEQHGGQAARSRQAFFALGPEDRARLLAFLATL